MHFIGCFNVTLYAYFDIHRIFDLILFRIWDFVLWWFDLDFVLFDYNFDFILCLSFLFIFVIHFFMKIMFSFMSNFVIINRFYALWNPILCTISTILLFTTFLFIGGLLILLQGIECYIGILSMILCDFQGFSDINGLWVAQNWNLMYTTYFFIFFYFVLAIISLCWVLLLRYFYTQSYLISHNLDTHVTNKLIDLGHLNLTKLYIIEYLYVIGGLNTPIYGYLSTLKINILVTFKLISMFYIYKIGTFNQYKEEFWIIILKKVRNLYNLNPIFTINMYRSPFSDITWMTLIPYIVFTINFFGSFVKDYTYINISYNPLTLLFMFTNTKYGFSMLNYKTFKKQLIYVLF